METPHEIIIVLHSVHKEIPEREAIQALPDAWKALPRHFAIIRPDSMSLAESEYSHWPSLRDLQKQQFSEVLAPLLQAKEEALVLYFGAAPIPLAIHLGSLLGNWRKVRIAVQDHVSNDWSLLLAPSGAAPKAITHRGLPTTTAGGTGDVVMRVATSYTIHADSTNFIQHPLAEIELNADPESPDFFADYVEVTDLVKHYLEAMQGIADHLPQAKSVHLFASVPVGIAFLLGKHLNPNVNIKLQTYQYKRERGYMPAFSIPEETERTTLTLEEKAEIQSLRVELEAHRRENINPFIQNLIIERKKPWFHSLKLGRTADTYLAGEFWGRLKPLAETQLPSDRLDLTQTQGDQFYDDGRWIFPDDFLHPLRKRLSGPRLFRAIRMFWFHEALHHSQHHMSSLAALAIGGFPKVVEEADYQADVYAMLHEYAYSILFHAKDCEDVPAFFEGLIRDSLETMWAFDDSAPHSEMQVRRFNRYMIWHYQAVRISDATCKTLADVVQILTTKPVIELSGLKIIANHNGRVLYQFVPLKPEQLELATFIDNKVARQARQADSFPLEKLIQGCRERDSRPILEVLKIYRDRTRPS